MAIIRRFEDIDAWKKARKLSRRIYRITSAGDFEKDFRFRDQIRAAVISAMSNVAEGFERDGKKEFLQFLSIAKGSVGEVRSQLYVALDIGYIDSEKFDELYQLTLEISRLLSGFIRYLRETPHVGLKFRKDSHPTA